jgi:hypothetical protein
LESYNSFGILLFICFRSFGNTFDENWMMKKLDEKDMFSLVRFIDVIVG